jgi:hypothetical protein
MTYGEHRRPEIGPVHHAENRSSRRIEWNLLAMDVHPYITPSPTQQSRRGEQLAESAASPTPHEPAKGSLGDHPMYRKPKRPDWATPNHMPDLARVATPEEQKKFNEQWNQLQTLLDSALSPSGWNAAFGHIDALQQSLKKWAKDLPEQDATKKNLVQGIQLLDGHLDGHFEAIQRYRAFNSGLRTFLQKKHK